MLKNFWIFVCVFGLLGGILLRAQESQAAAAPAADDAAVVVSAASGEDGAKSVSMEDVSKMSNEEMVSYLTSLDAEAFGIFIVEVINAGDRYLARRVISAANQVIAASDGEKAAVLVASVEKHGEGIVVVQDLTIRLVAPMINSLLKKFDVPSNTEDSVELPPSEPTYSAGATR